MTTATAPRKTEAQKPVPVPNGDFYQLVEMLAPDELALDLAASGERKVIFPTRMNLQLLAESADPADAVARSEARDLVTVEPWVDGKVLRIPEDAGYGPVTEPLEAL